MIECPQYRVPVFISSTYEDLVEYRVKVKTALDRLKVTTYWMEYFGARPGSSKSACLDDVRKCRIVVCIIGMRYGSIDENTGMSYTHMEYAEAQRLKIPTLVYLVDEEKALIAPKFMDKYEKGKKLEEFKALLMNKHQVSFFNNPDQLANCVTLDILPLIENIRVKNKDKIIDTFKIADLRLTEPVRVAEAKRFSFPEHENIMFEE